MDKQRLEAIKAYYEANRGGDYSIVTVMIGELIAEVERLQDYFLPNPCSICGKPIYKHGGAFIGTGDGSMREGGSFAHAGCYHMSEVKEAQVE